MKTWISKMACSVQLLHFSHIWPLAEQEDRKGVKMEHSGKTYMFYVQPSKSFAR